MQHLAIYHFNSIRFFLNLSVGADEMQVQFVYQSSFFCACHAMCVCV